MVGSTVGDLEGATVGVVGLTDGAVVVGTTVGATLGASVGATVGALVEV